MQKHFSLPDLLALEQRFRASLINSLGGFKSVNLVGTKNTNQQTNLSVFNSIVHIGANPPLVGMIVRPDSVERHTYENILETGYYTLNHLNASIYVNAHQTSARYPRSISEFEACNLSELYQDDFFAPYVKESNVQIGLELKEKIDIASNGTILLVGEIKHVYFPEFALQRDGFLNLESCESITCSGLDSYHRTQLISRLSYAKPTSWPDKVV